MALQVSRGDNILVIYYLNASETWPDKRPWVVFGQRWSYKRGATTSQGLSLVRGGLIREGLSTTSQGLSLVRGCLIRGQGLSLVRGGLIREGLLQARGCIW